jgi:CBS domain-containing protein
LQEKNINGVPVVDNEGYLVGVVAQEDIIYGAMGHLEQDGEANGASGRGPVKRRDRRVTAMLRERHLAEVQPVSRAPGDKPFWSDDVREPDPLRTPVSAVMTSPAIAADEDTPILEICRIMWNLQIHRIPILKRGKVTGLVSSMDLCRAILTGRIKA